jgi:hypothetical protein
VTSDVVILFPNRQEALELARREYVKTRREYRLVCSTMKCCDPEAQQRFREAEWRRRKAFERYMAALSAG